MNTVFLRKAGVAALLAGTLLFSSGTAGTARAAAEMETSRSGMSASLENEKPGKDEAAENVEEAAEKEENNAIKGKKETDMENENPGEDEEIYETGNSDQSMSRGRDTVYENAKKAFRAKPYQAGAFSAGRAGKPLFSSLQKGSQLTAQTGGTLPYGVGDRVRHVKFGEGTVLDIKEGGRDKEVTVEFDTAGVRKMFAMFAKLVKIG